MMRQTIREIPADCRDNGDAYSVFWATIPGSYGNWNKVENEKSKFVSGNVIEPSNQKQHGKADYSYHTN
jgi:hypothetical protein